MDEIQDIKINGVEASKIDKIDGLRVGDHGKPEEEIHPGEENQIEVITLSEIRAGEQPFACWGYSEIKRTINGREQIVKVPIKSVGQYELMEKFAADAPRPPRRTEFVEKDSEYGRSLNLKRSQSVDRQDFADEKYQKDMAEYEKKALFRAVLHALACDVKDAKGRVIVKANDIHSKTEIIGNEEDAIQVLMESGITQNQMIKIGADVKALSLREVQRTDPN